MQEWIEKAELICQLSGVQCIECIVPMHLSDGAYAVYQQLSEDERREFACIKSALYRVFALDSVSTWKEFMAESFVREKLLMFIWPNYRDSLSCLEECQKKA